MRDSRSGLRKLLAGFVFLVLAGACATLAQPSVPPGVAYSLPRAIKVQVRHGTSLEVVAVPLEDYVAATALSEVDPPDADKKVLERMFEVQAVLTRTYAVGHRGRHAGQGFDVCATTHCQLYEPDRLRWSKWTAIVREAAARTSGQILWFDNAPARAVYHADCGGHTSANTDVWAGPALPYLPSASDEGPARGAHTSWSFDTTRDALRDALNEDSRTRVGNRLTGIEIDEKDPAGRAERVTLRGARTITIRGDVLRDVVSHAFGVKSLRSTLFSVERNGEALVFTGRGFGHGVGLCQAGALARLQAGQSADSVLAHYFPGTTLSIAR